MDFMLEAEHQDIMAAARTFAEAEFTDRAHAFDREERFDPALWKKACALGFVGTFIDEAYGGAGMGFFEHALITEEFWAVDPGIGQAILATTFGAELVQLFATEAQKQAILPDLVAGKASIATAITEPDAGSDPAAASARAEREGDTWVISGTKMFITNASTAKHALIFCVTDPDAASRHKRHSFILMPTDAAGYKAEPIHGKMGIRASDTCEVLLDKVRVPAENLIGRQGEGFSQLMAFFNRTRIHICAQAVGCARGALEESIRHVKARRQFGQPLAEFQVIRFSLAEMATWIRAARNLYYEAAWRMDQGKEDHALIAMAKWYSAEVAVKCTNEAVQMQGGYGYIEESKVNRLFRAAKVLEIYEGTREMEKTVVAKSILQ